MTKKRLLKKSAGASDSSWCNTHMSTTEEVVCELCGTRHAALPENGPGRGISIFLGYRIVDECCGRAIDKVYGELSGEFANKFLKEFADNPCDSRFGLFRFLLNDVFDRIEKKAVGLQEEAKNGRKRLNRSKRPELNPAFHQEDH